MPRDPYEVLEVSKDASQAEIKKAFRKIIRNNHPDRNPGNEAAENLCKEAAEAFDIIGDSEKRAQYDRFGHAGVGAGAASARNFGSFGDIFSAFADIFGGGGGGDIFGGFRQSGPRRGKSYRILLELDFMEAARGCKKTISITRHEHCNDCDGSGAKSGTKPTSCPDCHGRGVVVLSQSFIQIRQPCPRCHGAGTIIADPCSKCRGGGQAPKEVDVDINIPPGVDEGMQIRVAGEGDHGQPGAPAGDLLVVIKVRSHEFFRRIEDDLVLEVPITFAQATLGASIEIPTLEGKETVKIKAGTPVGHQIVLDGKGFPDPTGRYKRGAARALITIAVPKKLSARQEELLREFAELEEKNVSPQRKSFFEAVKGLFG